jgi:hypothetical protein
MKTAQLRGQENSLKQTESKEKKRAQTTFGGVQYEICGVSDRIRPKNKRWCFRPDQTKNKHDGISDRIRPTNKRWCFRPDQTKKQTMVFQTGSDKQTNDGVSDLIRQTNDGVSDRIRLKNKRWCFRPDQTNKQSAIKVISCIKMDMKPWKLEWC